MRHPSLAVLRTNSVSGDTHDADPKPANPQINESKGGHSAAGEAREKDSDSAQNEVPPVDAAREPPAAPTGRTEVAAAVEEASERASRPVALQGGTNVGQCDYKGGVVHDAKRGVPLDDCWAEVVEARKRDPLVSGAEVSLDDRKLCWIISGIKGIKHPATPNVKYRCLYLAPGDSGNGAPAAVGAVEDQRDDGADSAAEGRRAVDRSAPTRTRNELRPAEPEAPEPAGGGAVEAEPRVDETPPPEVDVAELLVDDTDHRNPVIASAGYAVGSLILLVVVRAYRQTRRQRRT